MQFFAREIGCLDPKCPFVHDEEACMRDRAKVLEKRRGELGRPTGRELALREKRAIDEYRSSEGNAPAAARTNIRTGPEYDEEDEADMELALASQAGEEEDEDEDDDLDPEVWKIYQESRDIRKICSNPDCLSCSRAARAAYRWR